MARTIELLLLRTVEDLGIVGDIVRVKPGYARNYLLPQRLAEFPTPSRIEALKADRAKAQAELAALRSVRENLVRELEGVTVRIERSCNDQGVLYGSVTQRDIADALHEAGYGVDVHAVRLSHPIRRIDTYQVPIQFDKDLRTEATIVIDSDRPLEDLEESESAEEGEPAEGHEPQAAGPRRGSRRAASETAEAST